MERIEALADRVHDQQHAAHRATEQLSARLIGIEDAAQMASKKPQPTSAADAALAADLARARQTLPQPPLRWASAKPDASTPPCRFTRSMTRCSTSALREDSKASLSDPNW